MRVHYSSLTEESIRDSFEHLIPSKDVKNITDAGRARSIADWLVGANMTAQMTLAVKGDDVLSIGRVQTPTLKILVDREKEVTSFSRKKYYTVEGEFVTAAKQSYKGKIDCRYEKAEEAEKIKAAADKIRIGVIKNITKSKKTFSVPLLHNLSTLQMTANGMYGYTLADTLEIAQSLYENGYITYPRTDSRYLTEDMEKTVAGVLSALSSNPEYTKLIGSSRAVRKKSDVYNNSKVSSHFAIIPTTKRPSFANEKQKKVYDIIARSLIAHLYSPATKEYTTMHTVVGDSDFVSQGTSIETAGWLTIIPGKTDVALPALSVGDKVDGTYVVVEKETEPPKRFTDKTIVAAMIGAGKELKNEELRAVFETLGVKGIGTEATRASIIETLVKRGYVVRDKKVLRPTEKGIFLIDNLPVPEVISPELTAVWEKKMDDIANGRLSYDDFIDEIEEQVKKWCETLKSVKSEATYTPESEKSKVMCPKCGKPLVFVDRLSLYECSDKGCSFKFWAKICGKLIPATAVNDLLSGKDTKKLSGFTSKAGKKFSASLSYSDGKVIFNF